MTVMNVVMVVVMMMMMMMMTIINHFFSLLTIFIIISNTICDNLRDREAAPSVALQRMPDVYGKEKTEEEEYLHNQHHRKNDLE